MIRNAEWIVISLLAIVSMMLAIQLAPRREPFPDDRLVPDRRTVERQAEQIARQFGADLTGWTRVIRTDRDRSLRLAFEGGLVDPVWQLGFPSNYRVDFFGPNRQRGEVTLDLRGGPIRFRMPAPVDEASATFAGGALQAEAARAVAADAYATFWNMRPVAALTADFAFRLTADAVLEQDGYAFEWTSRPDDNNFLAWKLRVLVRDGMVRRFELSALPLEGLRERERQMDDRYEPVILTVIVIGLLAVLGALALTVVNLYQRRLPVTFVVRAGSFLLFLLLLDMAVGSRNSLLQLAWRSDLEAGVLLIVTSVLNLGIALIAVSAGRAIRVATDFRRWLDLEDFLRMQWYRASVTRSFLAGFLVGPIWLGISYVILEISRGGLAETLTLEATAIPLPAYAGIYAGRSLAIVVAVMFGIPLVRAYVSNRRLQGVLAVTVTAMGSVLAAIVEYPLSLMLLEALLHGLLLVYAYRRFGVLAAVLGAVLAEPLARAIVFFERGEAMPQVWGVGMLVAGALFFSVCLLLDLRNPNRAEEQRLSEEEFEALKRESERKLVTRRERLLGDFALAQQAQERMLPDYPPPLDGFEIASVCVPAQQVGGDLYDYVRLPDGRWALCVADVSGKGVSAALYMTMVKGLLSSLRLERSDLLTVVTALNRHIHRVIEKKSFVTMILAALDPPSRKLEVLRAGHPQMLFVKADGRSRFLESPGMGLGIASNAIFCRRIGTEQVRMSAGDVAVLYSDGVTEAMNGARDEFGEERLVDVVEQCVAQPADRIRDEILDAIRTFQQGAPVTDDITITVLKASPTARAAAE